MSVQDVLDQVEREFGYDLDERQARALLSTLKRLETLEDTA